MLFHSFDFLFLFLPLVLLGYFLIGRLAWRGAFAWLALASLVFYSVWQLSHVLLIVASILLNYGGGLLLSRILAGRHQRHVRPLLAGLITANLAALAYFKYLNFFVDSANDLTGMDWTIGQIVLPIGISFYTFTQIAYLVDVAQGKVKEKGFVGYVLFVTYFPHLVAGPILHHAEVMPQFATPANLRFNPDNFSRGLAFLAIGLFKKIVLADGCAPIANHAFDSNASMLAADHAWLGLLAYGLQIYFDFSGYSDMAIGISLMFNIQLPVNFNSPFQAESISEFWRRWHMTLSRFLRDYLYIPLGGSRKGEGRQLANLFLTMLACGLWHGASWTFVAWGGLQGIYLVINHLWSQWFRPGVAPGRLLRAGYLCLTLLAVTVSWAFFRADSMAHAGSILQALIRPEPSGIAGIDSADLVFVCALMVLALFAPNSNQMLGYSFGTPEPPAPAPAWLRWTPSKRHAVLTGVLLFVSGLTGLAGREQLAFLYFQF